MNYARRNAPPTLLAEGRMLTVEEPPCAALTYDMMYSAVIQANDSDKDNTESG